MPKNQLQLLVAHPVVAVVKAKNKIIVSTPLNLKPIISMKQVSFSALLLLIAQVAFSQQPIVKHIGKMSKIGQEKRVDAEILIDTIQAKNLYAIGPVENLRGEIIVWNSQPLVAAISEKEKPVLLKNVKNLKAIFLVYADVPKWDTIYMQQKITSMQHLQNAITLAAFNHGIDTNSAFPFLLYASIKEGSGHIMYKDTLVKTINTDALKAAKHIAKCSNQQAQMLGFYSQHHQTIFTHHDSFLHIHYQLLKKDEAGHLEEVSFNENEPVLLLLPHL